jgi:hypothetical protein
MRPHVSDDSESEILESDRHVPTINSRGRNLVP